MRSITPLAARISSLIARFRRQRPIRAGSLLITILGDSVAPRGGSIALASLIKLALPFGLTDRLVRTAVGRLALEDWVSFDRSGRASFYSLTEHGRTRFSLATQRIYAASPQEWDRKWTVVLLPSACKNNREQLRLELRWLGFGQLTPGVFIHPSQDEHETRGLLESLDAKQELIILAAQSIQPADASLAQLAWDFDELGRRYRKFIAAFAPLEGVAVASNDGELAFVLRTLLLHEYRKIHLRDPILPIALLPPDWTGTQALDLCRRVYAQVFAPSEHYLSSTAETLAGPLPPPADEVFERFGGLPRR